MTAVGTLGPGLAGCSLLTQTRRYEASPARLAPQAREKGYGLVNKASPEVTRELELSELSLTVTVLSHLAGYEHGSGIAVGLASTPAVTEAGQTLNPLATAPIRELLTRDVGKSFAQELGVDVNWTRGPERVSESQAELFGEPVDIMTFAGVTGGDEFVLLNVVRGRDEGDAVIVGTAWKDVVEEPGRSLVGNSGIVREATVEESVTELRDLLPLVRHGESPGELSEPSHQQAIPQLLPDADDDASWKELSRRLIKARSRDDPVAINEVLTERAASVSDVGLAAVFEFWAAENLRLAGRFEDAITKYDEVRSKYADTSFLEKPIEGTLLRKRALAEEELGRVDDVLSTYDEVVTLEYENDARAYYRKGWVAEEANRDGVAERAYRNAAQGEDPLPHNPLRLPELGKRAAERVADPFPGFHDDVAELKSRLVDVLDSERFDEFRSLASPTHFMVGPLGGCTDFVDREAVLADFIADAQRTDFSIDGENPKRTGNSVYLNTADWNGETFAGRVALILSATPQGWEFRGLGVGLQENTTDRARRAGDLLDTWQKRWDPEGGGKIPDVSPTPSPSPTPTPTATPTPSPTPTPDPNPTPVQAGTSAVNAVSMQVSAPWPKGEHFAAGGQPVRPLAPQGPCNAGPAGLYYKSPSTHQANDNAKFAIDFTQYDTPFHNNSASGTNVLATNYGHVRAAVYSNTNGSSGRANRVFVQHRSKGRSGVYTDYRSRYLHLQEQPNPMSEWVFVRQGELLGNMDNTGNSAFPHLHFNIQKFHSNESAVPTPMDGVPLNQNTFHNGRCVISNNKQP